MGSASVTAINTPGAPDRRESLTVPVSWPATFVLDESNEPGFQPFVDVGPRWRDLPHARSRSRGFILLPGERIVTDSFRVDPAHRVRLEAMRVIEHVSGDELVLVVELEIDAHVVTVTQVHLGNEQHLSGVHAGGRGSMPTAASVPS